MGMSLKEVILPVSDVDRAKRFYMESGFREEEDFIVDDDFRVVQMIPPGSDCAIVFGRSLTSAEPGTVQELTLVVPDVSEALLTLIDRGIEVSEVFSHASGALRNGNPSEGDRFRRGAQYALGAAGFSDPDGNGWLLREARGEGSAP